MPSSPLARWGSASKRFRDELKGRRYANLVREHFRRGLQNGIYGTPGLFVNGIRYNGALDLDTLRGWRRTVSLYGSMRAIEHALSARLST